MDILDKIELVIGEAKGVKGSAFTVATASTWIEALKKQIKAPYVNATSSTLGGDVNVSILFVASLQSREEWNNGYIENSTYCRLHLYNDGTIEWFNGYGMKKMRKVIVKDLRDAILKINKYITSEGGG